MGCGWKSFEVHAGEKKTLQCINGLLRAILLEAQKEKRRAVKKNLSLKEYVSNCEQNIGKTMDSKVHSNEVSEQIDFSCAAA
jgi:hypothetical protein